MRGQSALVLSGKGRRKGIEREQVGENGVTEMVRRFVAAGATSLRLVTLTTVVRSGTTVLTTGQINSCDAARRRVARTVTLTVNLPSNAATRPLERPFSGGALPIALGLILLPIMGRLTRGSRRQMGLVLVAAGIAAGPSGCGGAALQLRRRRPTC